MRPCSVALWVAVVSIIGGAALVSVSLIGPWVSLTYRMDAYVLANDFKNAEQNSEQVEIMKVIGDPRQTRDLCMSFQRGLYKYFGKHAACSHLGPLKSHRTSSESVCASLLIAALVLLGIALLCSIGGLAGVRKLPPKYPLLFSLSIAAIVVIAAVSLYPSKRSKYPPPLENANQHDIFSENEELAYGYTTAVISVAVLVCAAVITLCSIGVDSD